MTEDTTNKKLFYLI